MAKQTFIVSAGDRSITTTKSGIKSSVDTLLNEGFANINIKCIAQEMSCHRSFKVGDVVEIVSNNKSGHYFEHGEQVTVTSTDPDDFKCTNGIKEWWVHPTDIRLVK